MPTPAGAAPADVIDLLADLARRLPSTGPVGLAFPAVARQGIAWTAANIDARWIGTDARALLTAKIQRPVAFLNDADAAGIAEMRLGVGRGRGGTVLVLTLGTGIGSALFIDGRLVPNTELGHLQVGRTRGRAARIRADSGRGRLELADLGRRAQCRSGRAAPPALAGPLHHRRRRHRELDIVRTAACEPRGNRRRAFWQRCRADRRRDGCARGDGSPEAVRRK